MPSLVHGEQSAATIDNPCPIYDHVHNRTVLLFMRDMHSMWLTSSSTDGASWTTPRNITSMTMKDPRLPGNKIWTRVYSGPPGGIMTRSGRMLCPCHHAAANNAGQGGTDVSFSVYSDDFGESWKIGADNTAPGLSGENQLVELDVSSGGGGGGGDLLSYIRVNNDWNSKITIFDNRTHLASTRLFTRSTDGGEALFALLCLVFK